MDEPIYEDTDEEGNPIEDRRPKYTKPSTPFQKRMLGVCGRKWFKKGEKGKVIAIERTMVPLSVSTSSRLPTEWVEHCIEYAHELNVKQYYPKMTLPNLVKYINNEAKMVDWVAVYLKKHPVEHTTNLDDGLEDITFE